MRWLLAIAMFGAPVLTAQWTRIVQDGLPLEPRPSPPRDYSFFERDP